MKATDGNLRALFICWTIMQTLMTIFLTKYMLTDPYHQLLQKKLHRNDAERIAKWLGQENIP